jgi:hypothetical protein
MNDLLTKWAHEYECLKASKLEARSPEEMALELYAEVERLRYLDAKCDCGAPFMLEVAECIDCGRPNPNVDPADLDDANAPDYEAHVDQLQMKTEMERGWFPDETGIGEDNS